MSIALVAITGLALSDALDLLEHRPGGTAFEISERPVFMALFAAGVLLALRWEIVGGIVSGFTASGLVVFASQQLEPGSATVVIAAFSVPALLWILIDLNDQRPRTALLGLLLAATAVVGGALLADHLYGRLFGPTHPPSGAVVLPESAVQWVWSGAVTQSSFSVAAKIDDEDDAGSVLLVIDRSAGFADPRRGDPVTVDEHGIARFDVAGLDPDTRYHYAVEIDGALDRTRAGVVRTFPVGPASFTVAIGSDARVGSNGAVFDAIRSLDPLLLYIVPGDFHYANIAEPERDEFEDVLDLTLSRPGPAALYRATPVAYVWDDHDFGGNGSGPWVKSAATAHETYRRYVPHYPLAGSTSALYQAFTIGRVRFIITDGRSARSLTSAPDDAAKSMLGSQQRAWFERELLDADEKYPLIVWVNPVPWISESRPGADDWGGYATERAEIADFIADNDIDGLVMLAGDAHMVAIDDGTNSDYSTGGGAAFPVMHAAALDRPGEVKGGPYSEGAVPGGGQFGVLEVNDAGGSTIEVTLSGRDWRNAELISHRFTVPVVG
ncbi:MAG: alkaline phosphatase D family protein [Acidimicrobiales bacterium]